MTDGNREKRYIGRTDEELCSEGTEQLKQVKCPDCEIVVCSPMKRCIQTARILFPEKNAVAENDFRECDFGDFEGKNYEELSENKDYIKWIESGGENTFPNGESPKQFRKRCTDAFERVVKKYEYSDSIAFAVHGGTIMAVLEKFAGGNYFDWQCLNGHGYICEWNCPELRVIEKI